VGKRFLVGSFDLRKYRKRMHRDPRVDAYIEKAPAFAQPILQEFRARVSKACAAVGVEETIKWNVPFWVLGGGLLANMAAFKKHTKVGVWSDARPAFSDVASVAELPPAKVHTQQLQARIAALLGGTTATPASSAPAKQAVAKQAAAKKAAAKKPVAKQTVAKQAAAKKVSKKTKSAR
jgi:hypothetical protein